MFLFFAFPLTREVVTQNNGASHKQGVIHTAIKVNLTTLKTAHCFCVDDNVVTCGCVCVFVSSAGDGSAAPSVRDRLRDRVSLFTIIIDRVVNKSLSQIFDLLLQTIA